MSAHILEKNEIDLVVWAACAVRSRVPREVGDTSAPDDRCIVPTPWGGASIPGVLSPATSAEDRSVLGLALYELSWQAVRLCHPVDTSGEDYDVCDTPEYQKIEGYTFSDPEDVAPIGRGLWLDAWRATQSLLHQCAAGRDVIAPSDLGLSHSRLHRFVEEVGLRVAGRLLDQHWVGQPAPQGSISLEEVA